MRPDAGIPVIEVQAPRWQTWLKGFDPVGPIVTIHVLALAAFGGVSRPVALLVVAVGLLVWRIVLNTFAGRVASMRRGWVCMTRGVGSLVLAGGLVALDGGTESPLFFSMLIVIVWETVTNPVRRLIGLTIAAAVAYVGVIAAADDVTVTSLVRLGVFLAFIGLLLWGRVLSEHWQRESVRAKTLAAGIAEEAPIGFALYDRDSLNCLFANETARRLGLDDPNHPVAVRFSRSAGPEQTLKEVLSGVVASGEQGPPALYVVRSANGEETYLRIGVSLGRVQPSPLMVYAEDVTAQVVAGEQRRRFLETANHQFRTPLSPVIAYAEMIVKGDLEGEELREAAEAIRDGGVRIERLLDRISSLLRVQRDPHRSAVPVTIGELFDEHLRAARPDLDSVWVVDGDRDVAVHCDPNLLTVALGELIDNGRKHGIPPVALSVEAADEGVCLRLYDQGPGPEIDPETSLGQMWGLLTHYEVMPPEMGNRLGITYAHTLAAAAGASLRFERDATSWAFVLDLPAV